MTGDRTNAALAQIERRAIEVNESGHGTEDHWRWALDVLRGDREVLHRHFGYPIEGTDRATCDACCEEFWPCPDAARVLNRYAPEAVR